MAVFRSLIPASCLPQHRQVNLFSVFRFFVLNSVALFSTFPQTAAPRDIDMSDEQKDELILIVREMMRVFVNQSFELDLVQLSLSSQAKLSSQFAVASAGISNSENDHMPSGNLVKTTSDFEGLSP